MHDSIQELQYKVQSITLTNEMVDSQLYTLSKKDEEQNEIIQLLLNEISTLKIKNEMIIDLLREYKDTRNAFLDKFDTLEKRLASLENNKIENNVIVDDFKGNSTKISRPDLIPNVIPLIKII